MRPIPIEFHIGPLVVHTYGIGLAVTFWFGYRYFAYRLRKAGYSDRWLAGTFVWIVVSAIIGARAVHVVANLSDYTSNPLTVFAIWQGGLSSFGGLVLAIPTGLLSARRRCPSLRAAIAADLVTPVLVASWALGRLLGPQLMIAGGGKPTHQWFGMYYAGQAGKRLPVPIFQGAEDFAIFCVLILIERRIERLVASRAPASAVGRPAGAVVGTGMVLWGIERVLDEKLWLAYPGQLGDVLVEAAGVGLAIAGIVVLAVARRRWRSWLASVPSPEGTPSAAEPTPHAPPEGPRHRARPLATPVGAHASTPVGARRDEPGLRTSS